MKVLLIDDSAEIVESVSLCFELRWPEVDFISADEGGRGIELVRTESPDIIVLDLGLPDMDGLDVTSQIVPLSTGARILILTMYANEDFAIRLIRAGASGFVVKGASPDELLAAVRKVAQGRTYVSPAILEKMVGRMGQSEAEAPEATLSDREIQVLVRLARGATTREVSEELCLSVSTVETYRSRLLEKLNLRNNSDLTRFAIRRGLIDLY